jgi:citrate synthase
MLQAWAQKLFEEHGSDEYYDIAVKLEELVPKELEKLGRTIVYPNVDFYSGLVYRKMGIPNDLFTPIFGIARVAGWLAHWKEQLAENRIYRPTQVYTGLHDYPYYPIEQRNGN